MYYAVKILVCPTTVVLQIIRNLFWYFAENYTFLLKKNCFGDKIWIYILFKRQMSGISGRSIRAKNRKSVHPGIVIPV